MKLRHVLVFTTALASTLLSAGCSRQDANQYADRDTAVCVDKQGNRVPDDRCSGGYHGSGLSNAFLWYYLGRSSAVPYYGDRVSGGSFTRTPGATYFHAPSTTSITRSVAISRGGFGSSAHSFGGLGE